MDCRLQGYALAAVMLLASCSESTREARREPASPPVVQPAPPPTAVAPAQVAPAPIVPAPIVPAEAYKTQFAQRIVHASDEVFQDPLPKMLKSIVVLEVTLDRGGKLTALTVRRSNGYKALEQVALGSVRRAAPFAAPPRSMLRPDGSAKFLETFLFREDGRFQVRTLAAIQ